MLALAPAAPLHDHSTHQSKTVAEFVSAQRPEVPMPATPTLTSTPVDISTYPTPDLLHSLASMLSQLAVTNDGNPSNIPDIFHIASTRERPPIWDELFDSQFALSTPTPPYTFRARNIPSISLEAYLLRILRYCPTVNEVFLSLPVYFDRMSKLTEEATGSKFVIDSYNVHRLVIAGVTVVSKCFCDVFYTNSRYAKVGGLSEAELSHLELQFILLNDYHLSLSPEELQCYMNKLVRYSETDTDAETDDEPTIQSAYSCASSDTQSLISSDASTSEDGGFDDEDEGGDDGDDDGSATDDE